MARGKHGNHARGSRHYRWNGGRMLSDQRELGHLYARSVVIEAHLREGDIRLLNTTFEQEPVVSDVGVQETML